MYKIGDVIEEDGKRVEIIDIKTDTYEDGTVVTITNTKPLIQE